ncbi:MAG: Lrp/AsnC family transcriptional regulator [Paraburkholderia sp.]|uniref:Lrp/AsnC family transcriptional regulator n=1 Tax=Paraburkholderia denitrificans TaxID=694025 RepID=A0ABW0J8I1_9BURK|nr:Lrp/AsnC family transcriptional regulator [Paraburkholderia sp.]TAM08490.1 MAG: Lrp/AsnC family transcriptional regulator [Paraburkholderia sp.]TAM30229.1 MAG: Lrp/AsnC family transcriptional regulator [Paraburkholderia sp.]
MSLDQFDRKILATLQVDAALSMGELGERVGLSQSQAWRRVEKLERDGVIVRRVAVLDRAKLGLSVQTFTEVKLNKHSERAGEKFRAAVEQYPEVLEIHTVLGEYDFLLRIVTIDLNAYSRLLADRLSPLPMVQEVRTLISLSGDAGSRPLPVFLAP